jgi:hypothetical protein
MNVEDLLQGPLKNIVLDQLSNQLNPGDSSKTSAAIDSTVQVLLNAVAKNVAQPDGATSFINALNRDHDGSLVDHLTDYLGGQFQPQNSSTTNGSGILNHLLGNKQETAAETISKQTGLDAEQIKKIMATVAPILMGLLGKANQQGQTAQGQPSGGGLIDMILQTTKKVNEKSGQGNILTQILDKDGDGSIMDDVAGMGFKSILGRLFRK